MAPVAPAEPAVESASDRVFYGILQGLELRTMVPAQRLVEGDLAEQFDVGRNSVREALQRLAANGVVQIHRHRGASIRSLSVDEALEVLEVAEPMTGLLARIAARHIARDGQAALVRAALAELKAADAGHDPVAFSTARRHFYRALLDVGGNRELRRLFTSIQLHVLHAQYPTPTLQAVRLADYQAIGKAVLAGDEAVAEAAATAHVRRVREAALAPAAPRTARSAATPRRTARVA